MVLRKGAISRVGDLLDGARVFRLCRKRSAHVLRAKADGPHDAAEQHGQDGRWPSRVAGGLDIEGLEDQQQGGESEVELRVFSKEAAHGIGSFLDVCDGTRSCRSPVERKKSDADRSGCQSGQGIDGLGESLGEEKGD